MSKTSTLSNVTYVQFLSMMLGLTERAVLAPMSSIAEHGGMSYVADQVTILSRDVLLALACTCYERQNPRREDATI